MLENLQNAMLEHMADRKLSADTSIALGLFDEEMKELWESTYNLLSEEVKATQSLEDLITLAQKNSWMFNPEFIRSTMGLYSD